MKFFKKLFRILLWSVAVFTLGVVITAYFAFIYIPEKQYEIALAEKPYDVIIVPGVPFNGKDWDKIMQSRVQWAYHLYSTGIAKNVIFSGSAVYSPYVESKIMALYAVKMGIPRERVFVETRAEHSTENLYYSNQIAKKQGLEKIALATDPFQNAMLWSFLDNVDSRIETIPIKYGVIREMNGQRITIDPSSAKVENFVSLVERETKFERFMGTLGRRIKK